MIAMDLLRKDHCTVSRLQFLTTLHDFYFNTARQNEQYFHMTVKVFRKFQIRCLKRLGNTIPVFIKWLDRIISFSEQFLANYSCYLAIIIRQKMI